jgi:hypothetical protein
MRSKQLLAFSMRNIGKTFPCYLFSPSRVCRSRVAGISLCVGWRRFVKYVRGKYPAETDSSCLVEMVSILIEDQTQEGLREIDGSLPRKVIRVTFSAGTPRRSLKALDS